MSPGSGREVTINVTATLDDGSRVSDKKTFRIKDLPKPSGTITVRQVVLNYLETNVEIGKVEADLEMISILNYH